jgi:hypothetical protein
MTTVAKIGLVAFQLDRSIAGIHMVLPAAQRIVGLIAAHALPVFPGIVECGGGKTSTDHTTTTLANVNENEWCLLQVASPSANRWRFWRRQ